MFILILVCSIVPGRSFPGNWDGDFNETELDMSTDWNETNFFDFNKITTFLNSLSEKNSTVDEQNDCKENSFDCLISEAYQEWVWLCLVVMFIIVGLIVYAVYRKIKNTKLNGTRPVGSDLESGPILKR